MPIVHTADEGPSTAQAPKLHTTPVFKTLSPSSFANVRVSGGSLSTAFHEENPSPNLAHGQISIARVSGVSQGSDMVKKKRGRPRKYAPDGADMSLRLSPMSSSALSSGAIGSGDKPRRGRPRGSGWKQQLTPLGDWMNSSAGLAFTPYILNIGVGEDIAAKILAFAQQRPRALCVLSANGLVSVLTLCQPTTSGGIVTYEGRFQIICLSGSYLLAESGGPRNRTGGISISVCSPDGHVIGGAIGGRLVAANLVQVVVFSFVYNGPKAKAQTISGTEKNSVDQSPKNTLTQVSTPLSRNLTPESRNSIWSLVSKSNIKNTMADIDLMHG